MVDASVVSDSSPRTGPATGRDDEAGRARRTVHRPGGATWALIATALAYGLSQAQGWRVAVGWDESIYLSQVSRTVPAAFFSAPRARGISWLAAPLQPFTSSLTDLRIYLSVLSAVALFLAFRVWFRVISPWAATLAAVVFAAFWVTRFYGAQAMPNLWVAFGVVAGVGGYLRLTAHTRDRVGLIALPLGLAVAALMRPTDAAWVAAALLGTTLLVRRWRWNLRLYVATVAGSVLGAAPWVIETYQRFGGIRTRLHRASEIQGGLGWHPSTLWEGWQAADGPLLCRPCAHPTVPPAPTFWWLVIPVAVVLTVLLARRGPDRHRPAVLATALVPVVTGLAIALPYLLLVDYSAPRFLLPATALLCLPVGSAGYEGLRLARRLGVPRNLLAAALALVLGAHLVAQQSVLTSRIDASSKGNRVYQRLANDLEGLGVRPPCTISGVHSPQIAFAAACASRNVGGHDGSISAAGLRQRAAEGPVAVVLEPGRRVPAWARTWERQELSVRGKGRPWVAYLAPRP
jgi:hypothetical protein